METDSCSSLTGLWLVGSWLRPGSPEALLVAPSPSSGNSTLSPHTWKQGADLGMGSSRYTKEIQLCSLTLVSQLTVLDLMGNELGPQHLAPEPAWAPKSCWEWGAESRAGGKDGSHGGTLW